MQSLLNFWEYLDYKHTPLQQYTMSLCFWVMQGIENNYVDFQQYMSSDVDMCYRLIYYSGYLFSSSHPLMTRHLTMLILAVGLGGITEFPLPPIKANIRN